MATHTTVRFDPASRLEGELTPPADKSISHRAAIFGAMGDAPVRVRNYLVAADTTSSLNAVRALGASVEEDGGVLTIRGVGLRGARVPDAPIDVGNAGTLMRLLPGWLAAQDGRAFVLDGDDSIRRRPVDRIATPLRQMGATIDARDGRLPPFTVTGGPLHGITYALPVASAQIKSAVALAALAADGPTTIVEPEPSRDHTERMFAAAGVDVRRAGAEVTIAPVDALALGDELTVPGDPSSAAFAVAAALLVPGARVVVRGASTNWTCCTAHGRRPDTARSASSSSPESRASARPVSSPASRGSHIVKAPSSSPAGATRATTFRTSRSSRRLRRCSSTRTRSAPVASTPVSVPRSAASCPKSPNGFPA